VTIATGFDFTGTESWTVKMMVLMVNWSDRVKMVWGAD